MTNNSDKWNNASIPINNSKSQFSESYELVNDLQTVLNDLAVKMVDRVSGKDKKEIDTSVDKIKSGS